jgi:hypothetical protein
MTNRKQHDRGQDERQRERDRPKLGPFFATVERGSGRVNDAWLHEEDPANRCPWWHRFLLVVAGARAMRAGIEPNPPGGPGIGHWPTP